MDDKEDVKPSRLMVKLAQRLFPEASDRNAFLQCLTQPQPFHPCILWCGTRPNPSPFSTEPPLLWQPAFVDRLALGKKPGQHPLHHQGAFYCLDFSSIFASVPLLTIPQPVEVAIDVCAAPGGKSIFAWTALQPRLLISNEVIGKRIAALLSNLKRCQIRPAIALKLDSKILAQTIPNSTQVAIVDAPCTGQSLLAKGNTAPGCFHPVAINKNANRQKRILANSAQLVAPQGYLAYMTCAYSVEENEQVVVWFLEHFPQFQPVEIPQLQAYQSHLTSHPCYRMFPQQRLGAGAFTVLFHNTQPGNAQAISDDVLQRWSASSL